MELVPVLRLASAADRPSERYEDPSLPAPTWPGPDAHACPSIYAPPASPHPEVQAGRPRPSREHTLAAFPPGRLRAALSTVGAGVRRRLPVTGFAVVVDRPRFARGSVSGVGVWAAAGAAERHLQGCVYGRGASGGGVGAADRACRRGAGTVAELPVLGSHSSRSWAGLASTACSKEPR